MANIRVRLSPRVSAVALTVSGDGQAPATAFLSARETYELIRALESGLAQIDSEPARLILPGRIRHG